MQGYKAIGDLLGAAREERRLSIADVAGVLHIRPRYLVALEEGNLTALPGFPYVKGYLARYAHYLSLDREEVLRRFEEVALEGGSSSFFMPHTFSHDKHVGADFALKSLAAAFVALLIWGLMIRPGQVEHSLVEAVPVKPTAHLTPALLAQVACLRPQEALYPPCHWPQPVPEKSIMYFVKP